MVVLIVSEWTNQQIHHMKRVFKKCIRGGELPSKAAINAAMSDILELKFDSWIPINEWVLLQIQEQQIRSDKSLYRKL